MHILSRLFGFCCLALAAAIPGTASAIEFEWVFVDDADNPADTLSNCFGPDCGSVPYDYSISAFEVTNEQYAAFLNAKAGADPLALYNAQMGSADGGIIRTGFAPVYTYSARAGYEDKPVNYVSFFDAARFVNWIHNGQGDGDTETGAYTLLGGTPIPSNVETVTRNPSAAIYLPSENEWYKAAYYSRGNGTYFDYPTAANLVPICSTMDGTGRRANCDGDAPVSVGTYALSASPFGTFDQGGNLWEWTDELTDGGEQRARRGGSFANDASFMLRSELRDSAPRIENVSIGFRVATVLPPVQVCDDADCALLGEGNLAGAVAFGSDCTDWYVSLVIRDDPSQGFGDFDLLPRAFDVLYSEAMVGVTAETGVDAPGFDAFAEELTDGDPDELFLCYFTQPNLGGSGTCDSGTSPSGGGSVALSAIFDVPPGGDFAPSEVTTLRLTPTFACNFVAADVQVIPEPGLAGAVAALGTLGAVASWRRRVR